jgi:hypothetical protein
MSELKMLRLRAFSIVTAAFAAIAALPASAQSCALCYTQASSAGARMIEALRSGILVLIIPPTLMTVGMFFVVHRKTYQFRNSEEESEPTPLSEDPEERQ